MFSLYGVNAVFMTPTTVNPATATATTAAG